MNQFDYRVKWNVQPSDHQPSWQQSAGHLVCRRGRAGVCGGVWVERDPDAVPPRPGVHPASGQRLCPHHKAAECFARCFAAWRQIMWANTVCSGGEVLLGRPGGQRGLVDSRCRPVASRKSAEHHRLQHEGKQTFVLFYLCFRHWRHGNIVSDITISHSFGSNHLT